MNNLTTSPFWRVLNREWGRIRSRPVYVLLALVLPLIALLAPRAIFEHGVPRQLPIAICDLDHSDLSRQIIRSLEGNSHLQLRNQVTDPESGRQLVLSGRVYGLVILPQHLERDANLCRGPKIAYLYNNQWFSVGGIVSREIGGVINAETMFLKARLYQSRGKLPSAAEVQSNPIVIDSHTLFNPFLNYDHFLATPLVPTLLQVVVTMTTIFVIGLELKRSTITAWLEAAGGDLLTALAGKLLPYTIAFFVIAAAFNLWLFRLVGIPQQSSPALLLVATAAMVLAYQGVGVLIISVAGNMRLGLSAAAIYCGPAFAFSGVTFPFIAMTGGAKFWSSILPLPYFLRILVDQAIRGAPWRASLGALGTLCIFVLMGLLAAHFRLPKVLADEHYWGNP